MRGRAIRTSSSSIGIRYEDDHHWPWYLEDLTALGFDRTASTSQVLMFLYSDRTCVNRMLMTEARAPAV